MAFYHKKCTFTIIYCKIGTFLTFLVKKVYFSHVQASDFISGKRRNPSLLRKGTSLWGGEEYFSFKGDTLHPRVRYTFYKVMRFLFLKSAEI